MFTGIIELLGRIEQAAHGGADARVIVVPQRPLDGLAVGESIAVGGACLTVEAGSRSDRLMFYASSETLARTTLGERRPGESVNLERSLPAGGRLGGHLVMGHVDGIGTIRRLARSGEGWELEVAFPADLAPLIAVKGSIAVDGISLTVARVAGDAFTVAVIPHTFESTSLKQARAGDRVNLEADVLARYVLRAIEIHGLEKPALTREALRRAGFE